MACEARAHQLASFVDGELPSAAERDFEQHLRSCTGCAASVVTAMQQKKMVQMAARQFSPRPEFRAQIYREVTATNARPRRWLFIPVAAAALLFIAVGTLFVLRSRQSEGPQLLSELADLHVATLASANPVDVLSTDRHTVKPWFEGKVPFTFNLPEFAGTPYSLVGGKITYLRQSPGAELIFQLRQHRLSLFIFQERALSESLSANETLRGSSLNVCSWSDNGLHYFLVGEVGRPDLERLRDLVRSAH